MRVEDIALIPVCAECGERWLLPADESRWSAYLTDDEPPELVLLPGLRPARVQRLGQFRPLAMGTPEA